MLKDLSDNRQAIIYLDDDTDIRETITEDRKIILVNNADKKIESTVDLILEADLTLYYIDFTAHDSSLDLKAVLPKNNNFTLKTYVLADAFKKMKLEAIHEGADSECSMDNNSVLLKNGKIDFDVIGRMSRGCFRSKHYQKSRCLTMDNLNNARILPTLFIDENDVEAAHALTFGTVDEDTMYYLNSRGLSAEEAVSLIIRSYLKPDFDIFDDSNTESLKQKLEEMTSELC